MKSKRMVIIGLVLISMSIGAYADVYMGNDITIPGYFNGLINRSNVVGQIAIDQSQDDTTAIVNGNLVNWNSTFNGTYDSFLGMIQSLQSSKLNTPISGECKSGQYYVANGDGNNTCTNLPPAGSTITYFFHNVSANVSYNSLAADRTLNLSSPLGTNITTNVPNGNTLLLNFTTTQLNISFIPAGSHLVHIHASKTGGASKTDKLFYICGLVNATGYNYTAMGTSELTEEVIAGTTTEADIDNIMMDEHVNTTDKMIVSIYSNQTGGGGNPDITLSFDDNTDSRLILPATQLDLTPIINNISQLQINDTKYQNHSNETNLEISKSGHIFDTDINFTKNNLGANSLSKNCSYKFSETVGDNSLIITCKDDNKPSISYITAHDSYNQLIIAVNGVLSILTQNENLFNFSKDVEIDTQINTSGNGSTCFSTSGKLYRCEQNLNLTNQTVQFYSGNYSNLTNVPNMTLSNQSNIYAIYGGLNSDGTRRIGTGYTSNHNSTGHYFILFNNSYSDVPTVILTVHSTVANAFNGISIDDNGCGVTKTYVCVLTATPTSSAYVDVKFDFSVFGV